MGVPTRNTEPMTAEEFFAFTESRPDNEKWELIEGEPVLSPSASFLHQIIVSNLIAALRRTQTDRDTSWIAVPGIGVEVSTTSVPIPDVLVRPRDRLQSWKCDDMIVAFEILSPSSANLDLRWKRQAYARLASLEHYVVIAQDAVEVFAYDRANGFVERRLDRLDASLALPALGLSLPLAEIYCDTQLGAN